MQILDKKSMLLFVSCWLLLAILSLPSGASAAPGPQVSDAGAVFSDTFPLIENQFAVRQAHLAYLAVKEEVGMQATIRYIAAHNGSTGTLSTLMMKTGTSGLAIISAGSDRVLDEELENLRGFTRSFRGETDLQMTVIHGHTDELRAYVQSSVEGSDELQLHLDKYWRVRENTELAAFDLRVSRVQETIATLRENGYEITPAQEKLEEIVTMRTELATALRTRNNAGIELSHKKIHAISLEYARIIQILKSTGSSDSRLGQNIDQGIRVMTRSGMVNANLDQNGINTTHAKELVIQGKTQILAAQNFSRDHDEDGARAVLSDFRDTLKALRDTYRGILVREDLSQPVAQGVLSVAQALDITAAQMGAEIR
ncbi:MAG: hypothetical protein EHM53_01545 [Methanoregulaceae archaeon]|nr:MAG: hypothetical protein EHM53_01545 [Methanoregulaceae archaeon]